jgi:hypothetical protein
MTTRSLAALILVGALSTSGPALAQISRADLGALSARLNPGMTEQQVIDAIGYAPNSVSLQTCGMDSKTGPWTCKVYMYGPGYKYSSIAVLFQLTSGQWVVVSWRGNAGF